MLPIKNMTVFQAFLMILTAAAGCWVLASLLIFFLFRPQQPIKILGITIWGVLPAMQNRFAKELAESLKTQYLQPESISSYLDNEELLKQLTPKIEKYVDVFLEQKLPETFPLLAKLMGEKTLAKFKVAFLTEVEVIFPALIKNYSSKVLADLQPSLRIEQDIRSISTPLLEKVFRKKASSQLTAFKLIAAFAGAVMGLVQWLLISLVG